MGDILYGRNAVYESLVAGRRKHRRLLIAETTNEKGIIQDVRQQAAALNLPIEQTNRQDLSRRLQWANHQGVALETSDYPYVDTEDCLALADERQQTPLLLMLDHVQDPQNVGTLLRTAEAAGVHGIIIPERRAAGITAAVVNASSGASEHLQIVQVGNLAQAISDLQQHNIWVAGVEQDPRSQDFDQVDLAMPLALVIGAEGSGLARLTRTRCDFLVRLPMEGHIASLNVAVAASIVLYVTWRQRQQQAEI
jgi:23S rRNA (guanosine2251-2'-O)-methyltransferase